ncbi:MAG: histone deacetylase [Saccharofermentanales bacterium]|nr:histone deacetylase [Bacillota bacterium]
MMQAKNKLGLVFFPAFDWAISPSHPEREERLLYTQDQIFEEGIQDIAGIEMYNPVPATEKDVQRVHFAVPDVRTRFSESHMVSMGGAIEAFDLVFSGRADKSFALVRPPGHHAHRVVYGDRGFCVGNIEAVGLEAMRAKYGDLRVAVIDTDCHHGDGTEDIYWNDPDTLLISFHQDGRTLYPGTGYIGDAGGPGAYGYNVNIPLPPRTGEEGYLYVLENVIMPILDEYKPDLIVNSAGQDNHYSDPITNMNFTAQGYAILNERLNPDIAVLEGGYSIESALPYINMGIILAMAGLDYSGIREPDYDPVRLKQEASITEYVKEVCDTVNDRWHRRAELARDEYGDQKLVSRKKNIFYDTDGIMENQTQNFKVCKECSGLNYIDSNSDRGSRIKAITIPRDACSVCQKEGYDMYEQAGRGLTNVYLQDRINDQYHAK